MTEVLCHIGKSIDWWRDFECMRYWKKTVYKKLVEIFLVFEMMQAGTEVTCARARDERCSRTLAR